MNKIKSTLLIAALSLTAAANAQDLKSGYFNENYLYRHDLNPAFGNEKGYVAMPLLGNFNVNMRGNIGLKDLIFPVNGKSALFLNPSVSTAEFVKNIKDNSKITEDLKLQILGFGFKAFNGYNTLEVNVVETFNTRLPGSLLKAAKEGLTNDTYDFSNLNANAQAYVELALGHSHQVNDNLRVGGKLKLLFAGGNVDINAKKASLTLGQDGYTAVVDAEVHANIKEMTYQQKVNENTGHKYVNGIDKTKWGMAGFGAAVDLGAEYKMGDWDFSLSVLNLGAINYGKDFLASTDGEKTVNTDKYIFNVDDKAVNSFDKELDRLADDLSALYELEDKGNAGSRSKALGATVNVAAKYTLPSYDKLSFGLMNSTRIQGKYTWTDFRLSANIRPVKAVALSANVSGGTYGFGFGWLLDLQASKGIDFFIGMDKVPGKLAKQGIPLSSNLQYSMGINFPF